MEAYFLEWLNMFFRWFHVIAGVAWIGASFYFVWLDNSLENPPQWKKDKGIGGDLWAIHGGGFYEVAKYKLGPEKMPENLHWFKWEATLTWATGFLLLIVLYFMRGASLLIDPQVQELTQFQAVGISLAFLVGSWVFYDFIFRKIYRC